MEQNTKSKTSSLDSGVDAVSIIGENKQNDYILSPGNHAATYAKAAPEFSQLLSSASLKTIVGSYEESDGRAIATQNKFVKAARFANLAVLAAATLSGLVMAMEILKPTFPAFTWFNPFIGIAAAIFGALGGGALYRVREGKLLERWMSARATAETARLNYFSKLAELGGVEKHRPLLPLILQYFRRYQLDVQTSYYRIRREDHEKSAETSNWFGVAGTVLAALAAVAAASGPLAAFGVLGVVGAALIAYSVAREQINQDQRNAERYGRTLEGLRILTSKMDNVVAAAGAGNALPVREFVRAINDQLSLEHRQWLESGEGATEGLKRLNKALDEPED